jgi:hypothetical protein
VTAPEPLEPPRLEDEDLVPADLFGAAPPGGFDPVPVVTIGGVDVAQGPGQEYVLPPVPTAPNQEYAPPRLSASLIVVDGLSVTWGRDDPLAQPESAVGRLTLFDGSGTWATSLDLRGQSVVLSYAGVVPNAGPVRTPFFRGRVGSPVKVSRKTVVMPDGEVVEGSLVELPLVSVLVDLANRLPAEDWPEETVEARRARLASWSADVLPGGVAVRDFWKTPNVAPVPAEDQVSVLDHLVALYDSTGADRMTYHPDTQRVVNLIRRDYVAERTMAYLWWDQPPGVSGRAGRGAYARAITSGVRTYLDAGLLEYDPADGITQPDRVTRVELVHPSSDPAWNYKDRTTTVLVDGTDERRDGVRTARLESTLLWNNFADTAASDLEELAQKEGAAWRLQPLVFSSRRAGGFDSYDQARALLSGKETQDLFFLQGSWLPNYGLRPLFGVMGGTIGYRNRSWELELIPAPIVTTLPQHAITWEEFDDGSTTFQVQWWDEDHPRGLHESLTYEDLGYVGRGLNVSTVPPATGWDKYDR